MEVRTPTSRAERRFDADVEGNARLTAASAAVLLVVLLKVGSTCWRFARYYGGAPAYRRKGPPPVVLRLLGPVALVLNRVSPWLAVSGR
jgi:hypothetical protein